MLDFVEETEQRKKIIYQANSPGPVCILQIFGNNPSRGFRVRAETKMRRRADSAKTISLHHHIVGGDLMKLYLGVLFFCMEGVLFFCMEVTAQI